MTSCESIARERRDLAPGSGVNPGCEVIEGSVIIDDTEIFSPLFIVIGDDAIVGSNGATVLCPNDDLFSFERFLPFSLPIVGSFLS